MDSSVVSYYPPPALWPRDIAFRDFRSLEVRVAAYFNCERAYFFPFLDHHTTRGGGGVSGNESKEKNAAVLSRLAWFAPARARVHTQPTGTELLPFSKMKSWNNKRKSEIEERVCVASQRLHTQNKIPKKDAGVKTWNSTRYK